MTGSESGEATPQENESQARKQMGCLGWGVIFVLVIVVWSVVSSLGGEDLSSDSEDLGWSAQNACEEFVEKRLKSPSTAEFDTQVSGSDGAYTVTGTVDSQNSFGAMIRNDFNCEVHESGDQWVLDSLTGLDN